MVLLGLRSDNLVGSCDVNCSEDSSLPSRDLDLFLDLSLDLDLECLLENNADSLWSNVDSPLVLLGLRSDNLEASSDPNCSRDLEPRLCDLLDLSLDLDLDCLLDVRLAVSLQFPSLAL